MKNSVKKIIIFSMIVCFSFSPSVISAGENGFFSFMGAVSLVTNYVWRGWNILDNNPGIQPEIKIGFGDTGAYFHYWSSYGLTNRTDKDLELNRKDEIDLIVGIDKSLENYFDIPITLSAGGIAYIFPNLDDDDFTWELFAGVTFNEIILSPYIKIYYDFDLGKGFYTEIGGSYNFILFEKQNFIFSAALGINGGQYNTNTGISYIPLTLSTDLHMDIFTITPTIGYIFTPEESINPDTGEFWASIKASVNI